MTGTPTDAELVARCRRGDDAAWELLVERFARYVQAIVTRGYGLAPHAAEDVFQDVFTRAYEQLPKLRDDDAFRPWLAQAGIERIDEAAEEHFARLEQALTVRAALTHLPDHCYEVLDRFFARDESYATIGDALDIPSGTIASRISRCLSKLRQQLEGRSTAAAPSGGR